MEADTEKAWSTVIERESDLAKLRAELETSETRLNAEMLANAKLQVERDEARAKLDAYEKPHCWHCGDCLEPEPPFNRCDKCPRPGDCDDEECELCAERRKP